nr:hypothetical protein [Tanacetum cinerariifolium]
MQSKLCIDYATRPSGDTGLRLRKGLNRCRKSCRLRWLNHLRPNIKKGDFEEDEIDLIVRLHKLLGNRWSLIAGRIPGRTGNDVKNYWNTYIRSRSSKQNSETEENTSAMVTVIKPQPQTLSKPLTCKPPPVAPRDDAFDISLGLISSPMVLDDMIKEYLDELHDVTQIGFSLDDYAMEVVARFLFGVIQGIFILEFLVLQGSASLVTGHDGCYNLSTGTPCVDGFDVTHLESTVGHIQAMESNWEFQTVNLTSHVLNLCPTRGLMEACLPPESCSFGRCTISARNSTRYLQDMPFPAIQNPIEVVNYTEAVLEASNVDLSHLCLGGVTDGSSLGAIFNHFTGKFNLSPSSVTDGSSLGAIFNHFTGKFNLSPSSQMTNKTAEQKEKSCIVVATVANKEDAAYKLLESSSRSVHRKRTPLDDLRTSQVLPKATSKKFTTSVGTDHRKAVVVIVIRDTASQPLNTEPIPTNDAAT